MPLCLFNKNSTKNADEVCEKLNIPLFQPHELREQAAAGCCPIVTHGYKNRNFGNLLWNQQGVNIMPRGNNIRKSLNDQLLALINVGRVIILCP